MCRSGSAAGLPALRRPMTPPPLPSRAAMATLRRYVFTVDCKPLFSGCVHILQSGQHWCKGVSTALRLHFVFIKTRDRRDLPVPEIGLQHAIFPGPAVVFRCPRLGVLYPTASIARAISSIGCCSALSSSCSCTGGGGPPAASTNYAVAWRRHSAAKPAHHRYIPKPATLTYHITQARRIIHYRVSHRRHALHHRHRYVVRLPVFVPLRVPAQAALPRTRLPEWLFPLGTPIIPAMRRH